MKKENLKTCVLSLLIISSMLLTGKIWFNEKLWPEGYNFFSLIKDKISFGNDKFTSSLTKETLSFPKTLIVNNVEKRSVYTAESESFNAIIPSAKGILRAALESTSLTTITETEWSAALKSRSVHITYPVAYDSKLFLNILGSYKTDGNSIPVREFIITSADSVSSNVNVYIRNHHTSEIMKATVKWDKQQLDEMIVLYANDSIGDLSYSSELNFDKASSPDLATVQQKVLIAPTVPIQLNKRLTNMVEQINPIYSIDFNSDAVGRILNYFGYNVSGAKKYTERDNSIVFVENHSTMKLHPNGLLEYKAVDSSKGISLKGSDFYSALLGCVDFVNIMWQNVFPETPLNINISSDVIDTKSRSFTLTMEYFADGTQVVVDIPQSGSHPAMNHAVEIQIQDGRIVSYRQLLCMFETAGKTVNSVSAINALDKLLAGENVQEQIINDLYPVYITDEEPYRIPAWAVRTSDNRTVVIK